MSNFTDVITGLELKEGKKYSFESDRKNNPNSAIFFENGNVTVPQGNYFSSEFTITFWAKFDSLDFIEFFYFGNGYMDVIDIFFQESILYFQISFGEYYSSVDSNILTLIKTGIWNHFGFVLRNGEGFIYVDGNLIKTGPLYTPKNIIRTFNYFNYFSSDLYIDEIKIFEGAMNELEMNKDYNL